VQERIQLETARLYKQAGVNPLAGKPCLSQEGICMVCSCNVIRVGVWKGTASENTHTAVIHLSVASALSWLRI
jgi:hypothetical protein